VSQTIALTNGYSADVGNAAGGRWWWIVRGPDGFAVLIGHKDKKTSSSAERAARGALARWLSRRARAA